MCIDYTVSFSCTDRYTYAVVDGRALQLTVEKEESAAAVSRVTAQPKMPSPATRVIGSIVKGRDFSRAQECSLWTSKGMWMCP